jgi:hypothetical protein
VAVATPLMEVMVFAIMNMLMGMGFPVMLMGMLMFV